MAIDKHKNKLKIKLSANENKALNNSVKDIIKIAEKSGHKVSGPIPMPTRIHKIVVNKGHHVHKKSREQFEIRNLSRLILIHYPNQALLQELSSYELPSGVNFKIPSIKAF